MPVFQIEIVACLRDNYAYLIHEDDSGVTALVDAPESGPILERLGERQWQLTHVLITHHHGDHVEGLAEILADHRAEVIGAAADSHRLPPLSRGIGDGETIAFGAGTFTAMATPGHTTGALCYHLPEARAVFTADTLFVLGCGRLFEGSADAMWSSLSRLMALPDETAVYCGHEYAESNARFALAVDLANAELRKRALDVAAARAAGRPTVPSSIGLEKATNPFLRATNPRLAESLGLTGAAPVEVFAELRRRKDVF